MSSQIKKLLSEGDTVYSAFSGIPMKVTKVCKCGFYVKGSYFSYSDVRKKYFLTKKGYENSLQEKEVKSLNVV